MFGAFSDIRGVRSTDGGASWGFGYSGHTDNSMYRIAKGGDGKLYAATATVHDLYQSTRLTDAILDAGKGQILSSTDGGATWTQIWNPGRIVAWVESDPSDPKTLYASVVHSTTGGVFVTHDLDKGASATWTRLPAPARTQGHPYNLVVLPDGSLLSSWSGRREPNGAFAASSGVFRLAKGATAWEDLSDVGMKYWTKDLVVDPQDATGKTWWVAVFSGWGGPPNALGGLYRTTDAGAHWTRVWNSDRVESIAFPPGSGAEAYVTTETDGLWHTAARGATSPTFERVASYPFRQPVRVFFNPYDTAEMWVASFGNSLRMGRRDGRLIGVTHRSPGSSHRLVLNHREGTARLSGLRPDDEVSYRVVALDGRVVRAGGGRSDANGAMNLDLAVRGAGVVVLADGLTLPFVNP